MHLENLLKNFPNISLATDENNEEILEFFNQFSLKDKSEQVHYHRDPDFFALLKARGSDNLTFLLREDDGSLKGIAAVSLRKGYIKGKEEWVGYLGDLRVSLNRKLIRQWRKCFKEFLIQSPKLFETHGCKFYQTALMDTNSQSKANLASNKMPGVHYNLLNSYKMVNVVGKLGTSTKTTSKIVPYSDLSKGLKEELVSFIEERERTLPFGHKFQNQLNHRYQKWIGFSERNILALLSIKNEIEGATFFYDPRELKTMSLSHIPSPLKVSSFTSKIIPFFYQTQLPKPNQKLSVIYLENGHAKDPSKENLLYRLSLEYLLKQPNLNMVALTEWENHPISQALKGFIYHKTPMGLYTVHPLSESGRPLYTEELSRENYEIDSFPRFDMAMV